MHILHFVLYYLDDHRVIKLIMIKFLYKKKILEQ